MSHDEIMEELASIRSGISRLECHIAMGTGLFEVFHDGLEVFKTKNVAHLRQVTAQQMWNIRFQSDPELRFPHRKILECLLRRYDHASGDFGQMHFSALVHEARVSKSRAKQYLAALESKGHIRRCDTGYRTFYRITGPGSARHEENH